jgi:hypothetical protein
MRSGSVSSHGASTEAIMKKDRSDMLAAATFGKHLATHKVTNGHIFWQSGSDCFCCGQGISSAILAILSIAAIDSTSIIAAADGAATKLRIVTIESKRAMNGLRFTPRSLSYCFAQEKRDEITCP